MGENDAMALWVTFAEHVRASMGVVSEETSVRDHRRMAEDGLILFPNRLMARSQVECIPEGRRGSIRKTNAQAVFTKCPLAAYQSLVQRRVSSALCFRFVLVWYPDQLRWILSLAFLAWR